MKISYNNIKQWYKITFFYHFWWGCMPNVQTHRGNRVTPGSNFAATAPWWSASVSWKPAPRSAEFCRCVLEIGYSQDWDIKSIYRYIQCTYIYIYIYLFIIVVFLQNFLFAYINICIYIYTYIYLYLYLFLFTKLFTYLQILFIMYLIH